MHSLPRRTGGLVLLAAVVVACGGGTPTASNLPSIAVPSIALPSIALPSIAIPSLDLPSIAIPSIPINPDEGLEALFPDEIGGHVIEVDSANGESFLTLFSSTDPAEFNQLLSDLGTTIDNVSGALSFGIWPGASAGEFTGLTMLAFQVRGVSSTTTLARFATLVAEDVDNAEITTTTIGGKGVTSISNPEDANENVYMYGYNDIVFMVGGTPIYVEEAFSKLP